MLMKRIGRRPGFLIGTVFGAIGGLVSAYAVYLGLFWLLVAAASLNGIAAAFVQQYRFAATDIGDTARKAKSISWVLAGGIAAAVIGPQTVIGTRDLFDPIPFVGSYLAIAGLASIGAVVLMFIRPTGFRSQRSSGADSGRSLAAIITQARFVVALLCAAGAYGVMVLLMTAAPLAMVAGHHSHDHAALGVQWHVIAMFAPSFVTGSLVARYGAERIIAVGMAVLLLAGVTALTGQSLVHFWGALVLLGVGWNFGFIGATTMLTQTYRPEEAGRAQGFNDFVVFTVTGIASFASGKLLAGGGWEWVSGISFPVIAVCLLALAFLALRKPDLAAPEPL
jgi:MFS family permease